MNENNNPSPCKKVNCRQCNWRWCRDTKTTIKQKVAKKSYACFPFLEI